MNYHDQIKFLRERDAWRIAHSHSTLLSHLEGTYLLLREWGNDEDTCVAGLFHSVYGTHNFPSVIVKDRDELHGVISKKAEQLVWLLRIIDALAVEIDEDTTRRLVEIQVADLVEQSSRWNDYHSQQKWVRGSAKYLNYMSNGARLAYTSLYLEQNNGND